MKRIWIIGLLFLAACASDEIKRDRFFLQGNEALNNRDYRSAINYYTKAIGVDKDFARAYNNRGVAQIETGHAYEAIQDYNIALGIDPNYQDALFNRAYAYEEVGRLDDALGDVAKVKLQYSDSAYVYFYEGLLQSKLRLYDESQASFLKAATLDPANEEIDINLATLYYFKDQLDSAKQLLMKVLKVNRQQLNALNTLSQVYLKEGDIQNSLITINRAIDLQPADPYLLNNRGQIYLEMGELDKGLEDINKSILQDPENLWAYRNKGIYHLMNGNASDAIRLLEKAISKRELVDEVHSYLGQAYQLQEDMTKACEQWQLGVEKKESRSVKLYEEHCQ